MIQLNRPEEAAVLLESAKRLAQEMIQNNERSEQIQFDLDEIETLLKSIASAPVMSFHHAAIASPISGSDTYRPIRWMVKNRCLEAMVPGTASACR